VDTDQYEEKRQPFGAWLVTQKDRGGFVGQIASVAAADRRFPKSGDPTAVRKWLQEQRPSGDDWEALEDAENAWPDAE
jgi:hypothetical protein